MFPIYILEDGVTLPEEGTYYIVAKDGIYIRKDMGLVTGVVKVDRISSLRAITPEVALKIPIIPGEILARTILFFRSVYTQYRSEAIVLLHYSEELDDYQLSCPQQRVSPSYLGYAASDRIEGYSLVGSIHSHASMPAWHSSTDHHDEMDFDGIHITVGRLDQPYVSLSSEVAINGNRFSRDPCDVVLGVQLTDWHPRTVVNYRRVVSRDMSFFDMRGLDDYLTSISPTVNCSGSHQSKAQAFYDIVLPNGKDYRHVAFPRTWMNHVMPLGVAQKSKRGGTDLKLGVNGVQE